MSIKYYANRVQETSTSTGAGNLVLSGAPLGFRPFTASIGANNTFNYYIYRQDTNFEWEIGVGYISSGGGINQLIRQRVVASSNGNSLVGFTSGTKYVETVISQDRANTSFINVEEKSSNFTAPYMPATYIVDASVTGVQVSLPVVTTESDPIVMGFMLSKTVGSAYEQIGAIQLIPSGTETIAGTTGVNVSILNDYLQIVSVPSQSGWLLLDPIQDSTNPYGNEGSVQFKSGVSFSGVDEFVWDSSNKLLIGDSGLATADIVLPASSGQTTIFNQNLVDNDLRVAGSGNTHLLFTDGGLNRVGINSSVVPDTLSVNASSGSGITISRSGVGPRILLSNTSVSGITSNNIIGSIVFSGLNNSGNSVQYGLIKSVIENNSDNSEHSSLIVETVNNGSVEEIAVFSPSGITLGSSSQNFDGIVLGAGSDNEGNNIVAGYFNSVCGENCVVLGDNTTVSSGTFGGAIGSNHTVSGVNIWVLGGSGVTSSGNNKTILALDEENYLEIQRSGSLKYTTLTDSNTTLSIDNISVLTSGVNQNIAFTFLNTSGVHKTGLLLTSNISDVTNNSEDSSFVAKILSGGSQTNVLSLDSNKVIVGENSVSGNNMVFGLDNTISNTDNIIFGKNISATGSNNILIGNTIALAASGTGITIIGKDNQCLSSGTLGVVILGNGNQSNEDYSIAIGIDNANSGLYTVSCGYLNGVHGDYSVGIGEGNTVVSNYSVAIGRNNNLTTSDLSGSVFAMGVGNSGNISNTGILVGYLNTLSGSGGIVVGRSSSASGLNNLVVGNNSTTSGLNNIIIGNNRFITGTGIIDIFANSTNGLSATANGFYLLSDSDFIFNNDVVVTGIGTFASGIISSGNINCSGTGIFSSITVTNNVNCGVSGIFNSGILTSGNINCSGTGIFNAASINALSLPNIPSVSGTGSIVSLVYQNNQIRGDSLAYSGIPNTGLQLIASDSEYQFLYPTGTTYVYLPNGSGIYMGKKFTIVNMDNSNTVYIRKSGDVSDLGVLSPGYNMGVVHAGNDNWIRITYHSFGSSLVIN